MEKQKTITTFPNGVVLRKHNKRMSVIELSGEHDGKIHIRLTSHQKKEHWAELEKWKPLLIQRGKVSVLEVVLSEEGFDDLFRIMCVLKAKRDFGIKHIKAGEVKVSIHYNRQKEEINTEEE